MSSQTREIKLIVRLSEYENECLKTLCKQDRESRSVVVRRLIKKANPVIQVAG